MVRWGLDGPIPWPWILAARIILALAMSTTGPPDEYWQGPEVAYHMVFGKGELTWEWSEGIRSSLHPSLYAMIFYVLKVLHLDTRVLVIALPRVLHGVLAFVADCYVHKLAQLWYPHEPQVATVAVLFSAVNWFTSYCTLRTFSNSIEAVLLLVAVSHLQLSPQRMSPDGTGGVKKFLFFAGMATALRPTACVWVAASLCLLVYDRGSSLHLPKVLLWCTVHGALWVAVGLLADRVFYGEWVFTPWRFFAFNVMEGKSELFGTHPFHWYFTQGLPAMVGTMTPWLLLAFSRASKKKGTSHNAGYFPLALLVVVTLLYSLLGHKEFRFLLPVHYLALIAAADGYVNRMPSRGMLLGAVATNFLALLYFCFVHQRGTISLMTYLGQTPMEQEVERLNLYEDHAVLRVDLLLPCYQTPGYSYLHNTNVTHLRQLGCSPMDAVTEHRLFREYPLAWTEWAYGRQSRPADPALRKTFATATPEPFPLPAYFAVFQDTAEVLKDFFRRNRYVEVRRFGHTPTPFEGGTDTSLLLLKRQPKPLVTPKSTGPP